MEAGNTLATGMAAQDTKMSVHSHNIANLETTAFKKSSVQFVDLLYRTLIKAGTAVSDDGSVIPVGKQIGSGTQAVSTPRLMTQGAVESTDRPLDIAIQGEGFFRVQMPDGSTAYTRDGTFELNEVGTLVTSQGLTVDPSITVPELATEITIAKNGEVQAFLSGETTPTTLGQINLARFVNPEGLESIGNNLYRATQASGQEQIGLPGDTSYGSLLQGFLEKSNVVVITELYAIMNGQKSYSACAKAFSLCNETERQTINLFG